MVDFGGIGGVAIKAASSWLVWLLAGVLIIGISVGALYLRRRGKMRYPTIIVQDLGGGKRNFILKRAGWFKSKKILGGLFDYAGERRLETNDGRIIQKGSSQDFHEVNYTSALVVQEKADDPKILIPIGRFKLDKDSEHTIMEIAPADYRDASSRIMSDVDKETTATWQTVAQLLVFGFVGVILFVSIILTIQYTKNVMAEAQAIHKEALAFYEQTLSKFSTVSSNAP